MTQFINWSIFTKFLKKRTTGFSLCVFTASILRKNGSTLQPTFEEKETQSENWKPIDCVSHCNH